MNKESCKEIVSMILNEDEAFSQSVEKHCLSCKECKSLRDSWTSLREVKPEAVLIPLALEKSVLDKVAVLRKRAFMIKHIFHYTAFAAALCIGFIVVFNRTEPIQNLPSTSMQNHQWSWEPVDTALLELQKEIERAPKITNSPGAGLTYSELNVDTVIDSLNYYEVIL
ncbi:MAG: hypothetical protein PHS31_09240 [Victivallaceae bacterium]|nr:hypothetical protein [Victivallaceae bacterium]